MQLLTPGITPPFAHLGTEGFSAIAGAFGRHTAVAGASRNTTHIPLVNILPGGSGAPVYSSREPYE